MWVLKRTSDGQFIAKTGLPFQYTTSIRIAEKFETKRIAESNCNIGEYPVQVDTEDYFKRG